MGLDRVREIVARTNAAQPDLVVICGDLFVHGLRGGRHLPPEDFAPPLGELRASLGTFAILGNHDWWVDGRRMWRALEAWGIPVLEDRAVALDRGGQRLWVAGISDLWERTHDVDRALSGVDDDAPVIAFTHNPDVFPEVPDRVAITFAGHTHGGQVRLPFLGARSFRRASVSATPSDTWSRTGVTSS